MSKLLAILSGEMQRSATNNLAYIRVQK